MIVIYITASIKYLWIVDINYGSITRTVEQA